MYINCRHRSFRGTVYVSCLFIALNMYLSSVDVLRGINIILVPCSKTSHQLYCSCWNIYGDLLNHFACAFLVYGAV